MRPVISQTFSSGNPILRENHRPALTILRIRTSDQQRIYAFRHKQLVIPFQHNISPWPALATHLHTVRQIILYILRMMTLTLTHHQSPSFLPLAKIPGSFSLTNFSKSPSLRSNGRITRRFTT